MQEDANTKKLFASVMWGLAEDFGGKLSKHGLKLRFTALRDYDIAQIQKAGTWLLKHREATFPAVPTTKEIIEAIEKVEGVLSPTVQAGIEFDKVVKKFREWGRDAKPLFYDKLTVYLMTKRWTFNDLDQRSIKDPAFEWFRKEFVTAYVDLCKTGIEPANLLDGVGVRQLEGLVKPKLIEG